MKHRSSLQAMMAVIFLVLALAGCSSVTIKEPLPMSADTAERARFEGEWVSDDQIFYIRFGSNGIGQFAGVDWKNGSFQMERGEFVVSKGTEGGFLSARVLEQGKWQEGYFLVQYHFTSQGDLVLWLPAIPPFCDAVEKGKIKGRIVVNGKTSKSVELTSPPEKILAFLNDPANGVLFDYRDPMIFKRLILKLPK